MRAILTSSICLGICIASGGMSVASAEPTTAIRIQIQNQPITPVTAQFVERALGTAQEANAECFIIELDTPGGLMDSTQEIVTDILSSRVPVVVFVSPSGGRAASAGLFITLAGHVAAMAPGTRIGAAHPVQLGGLPISPGSPPKKTDGDESAEDDPVDRSPMEDKLVNDTVAWARSLAELRGRNGEWAALAVSESRVMLASEAVREGVVDMDATDVRELLQKIDGREVSMDGQTVQLHTADATINTLEMWWGEKFLAVISNPNVVMFLLMFGVYGILFEFYSPGWGVAGTLGVVSLVLALFGLSLLPVNYAGLALILIGLVMFVAEATVTSFGALTLGGIVCFILGGMMLVDSPTGFLRVSLGVVVPIAVATGLITVFLLSSVVKAHRGRVQTGGEDLLGRKGVAQEAFASDDGKYQGQVFIHGEIWRARSSQPVCEGQSIRVTARDGLTLEVATNGQADTVEAKPRN